MSLSRARLAELRKHYERFDKHSPTAIELIDEIERLRAGLVGAPWRAEDGDTKCQRCHGPNTIWFADSDLWNRVVGGDPNVEAGGVLCLRCFAEQAGEPLHIAADPMSLADGHRS